MAIKDFFVQTAPGRRRYGVALLVGVIAGIMSAFVKWGRKYLCRREHFPVGVMNLILLISFYATILALTLHIPCTPSLSISSIR